ncbi:unnamed protein product [Brachionus calyciflorus]|uniref:EF-hand domain-containing protein n=1 Tax=Brachionus calyciflorus TaxID=104777 RepID=A0A813SNG0_9BILA|nr:unnamed protein product [Brachionus calyciflorus]
MGSQLSYIRRSRSTQSLDKITLDENELRFLIASTKMSREQIIDFHENFLRDCPSGYLTKKEFVKMFKELYHNEDLNDKADKFCEYVFKAIDANSNNLIEFSDFIICFSTTTFGTLRDKIELAFKIYDLNSNKRIDKYELTKVLDALFLFTNLANRERKDSRTTKQQVDFLMKKLDKNRNHVIEYDEFYNGIIEDEYVRSILIDKMFNS